MLCPTVTTWSGKRDGQHRGRIMNKSLSILRVDSSGRYQGSSTRALADKLIAAISNQHQNSNVVRRDLAQGIKHVDESWIQANFTAVEERSDVQKEKLQESDGLVAADVVVIGVPVYNFGVPAALKAWVDMVARARLTFRYTETGSEGLLGGKKAYLVVASGGVPVDSDLDFATPYMRHALRFLGITDIEVVSAEQQNSRGEVAVDSAIAQIAGLFQGAEASVEAASTI